MFPFRHLWNYLLAFLMALNFGTHLHGLMDSAPVVDIERQVLIQARGLSDQCMLYVLGVTLTLAWQVLSFISRWKANKKHPLM